MPFLDPAKMIAEYGAYFKEGGINAKNLHKEIMTKSDTDQIFTIKKTNNTRIDEVNVAMTDVLQPFFDTFSHLGGIDFDPNPWNLDRVKINVSMKPDALAETALDFMVQKGVERKNAPVVKYIADYLLMKAKENYEEKVVFLGERALPSPTDQANGVAGTTAGAGTGLRKVIRDYVTDGATQSIAMGAVPTDPQEFVEYVEDFVRSIPEKFKKYIKWVAMSTTLESRYKQGMRIKYLGNYAAVNDLLEVVDQNVKVRGFDSHIGSTMIWTSIPENCIGFVKNPSNKQVFALGVKDIYLLQMATDWYVGKNFINPNWVWHNAQDLTLP